MFYVLAEKFKTTIYSSNYSLHRNGNQDRDLNRNKIKTTGLNFNNKQSLVEALSI